MCSCGEGEAGGGAEVLAAAIPRCAALARVALRRNFVRHSGDRSPPAQSPRACCADRWRGAARGRGRPSAGTGAFALEEANYLLAEHRGEGARLELAGQRSMAVAAVVPHAGWNGC